MITRAQSGEMTTLAEKRQIIAITNKEVAGRDGLILMNAGCSRSDYMNDPIVLSEHNTDWPIGRVIEMTEVGDELRATIQFPRAGISQRADEVFGLIGERVLNATSTGFKITDAAPITVDGERLTRVTQWELMELSIVSIPALPSALVIERGHRRQVSTARRAVTLDANMPTQTLFAGLWRSAKPGSVTRRQIARHLVRVLEADLRR